MRVRGSLLVFGLLFGCGGESFENDDAGTGGVVAGPSGGSVGAGTGGDAATGGTGGDSGGATTGGAPNQEPRCDWIPACASQSDACMIVYSVWCEGVDITRFGCGNASGWAFGDGEVFLCTGSGETVDCLAAYAETNAHCAEISGDGSGGSAPGGASSGGSSSGGTGGVSTGGTASGGTGGSCVAGCAEFTPYCTGSKTRVKYCHSVGDLPPCEAQVNETCPNSCDPDAQCI